MLTSRLASTPWAPAAPEAAAQRCSSGGQAWAPRQRRVQTRAQQAGGFGDGMKRMAKQVVGQLPIIGLVSRWAATEGGVGNDEQAYPEFCRQVFDAAPEGFQVAVAELQDKHGKAAQRRYVLLALWMARHGAGVVPGKTIVDAARRVRVSADVEYEVDRFTEAVAEVASRYTYMDRPRGTPPQQADVAVDALARLVLNLKDGQPIPEAEAPLIEDAACGGFWDVPGFREEVRRSIAQREQRAAAYA